MIAFVHYALALALIIASIFDVLSTNAAINVGAYEANPLMAWFQKVLGAEWWLARIGLALAPVGLSFLLPPIYANVILFALLAFYVVTVMSNYALARDPRP